MAIEIDAFAVLKAIGNNPATFADVRVEATKAAKTMVIKQLKAKSLTLQGLGALGRSLGEETLALILDAVPGKDLKPVLKRIDERNPNIKPKEIDVAWARRQLLSLALGSIQPVPQSLAGGRRRQTEGATRSGASPIGTLAMRAKRVVGAE